MRRLALVAFTLLFSYEAEAIWPFRQKRFEAEVLIDAGPLGLEDVKGRVVAVGDWNGDQNNDLFVLSPNKKEIQCFIWDRKAFRYTASQSITVPSDVQNVIPGDFDRDGRLDLLVMSHSNEGWWGGTHTRTSMDVYLGGPDGTFKEAEWTLPDSTGGQPIVFDADGTLRPSLLGFAPTEGGSLDGMVKMWRNTGATLELEDPPLSDSSQACHLASPHSSAFIDIDGDCLPDLVLHCSKPRSSHHSLQIWLNQGQEGFSLARTYDLPKGSGPISFADMNRDGSIDIIFPICDKLSASSGIGHGCNINIAYNRQIPICSSETSQLGGDGKMECRGWGELCSSDPQFAFDFSEGSRHFTSISLDTLFPEEKATGILLHAPDDPNIPFPLRPGDFNVDGFPDLLLTLVNATAAPKSGPFGGRKQGAQAKVLVNTACKSGIAGCEHGATRGLRVGRGKGWDALDQVWDTQGASWLDNDDDGTLDILLQRSGEQNAGRVTFIQNNFYHDAFFLKALVLNGACDGECEPFDGSKKYSPAGSSYSGATYKFTVLDTLGRRGAQQVAQLPQTGYHALGTPYAFVGLGRTNNYIERLTVGSSLYPPLHITDLESIVPNSQLIINPPSPPDNSSSAPPVRARSQEWRTELFLHPGDWIPWVSAAVIGTVLALAGVVIALNEQEKREDEKERRRALHAINFQAL